MSKRARFYAVLIIDVLAAVALTSVANAGDWERAQLYGAAAGLILVIGLLGMAWMEMAPDGAWRRPPERRPRA